MRLPGPAARELPSGDLAFNKEFNLCGSPDPGLHCGIGGIGGNLDNVLQLSIHLHRKVPKKCVKTIRERDGKCCKYMGKLFEPDEGSLSHALRRSRGSQDTWENLAWSSEDVNVRKGNCLPHEASLKLLSDPCPVRCFV